MVLLFTRQIAVFVLLGLVFGIFSLGFIQNAYAGVPTVISAEITAGNIITIVYSEPVISLFTTDYADLQLVAEGARSVDAVLGTGTDTILITFSGAAAAPNETATIDITAVVRSVSTSDPIVPVDDQPVADGQAPLITSTPISSAGLVIDAAEEAAGFTITAGLGLSGAVAGDTLALLLNGGNFPTPLTRILTAGDIAAGEYDFTISSGQLGADGVKLITSRVTDASGNIGAESLALTLTVDAGILGTAETTSNKAIGAISSRFNSLVPSSVGFVQAESVSKVGGNSQFDTTVETQYIVVEEPFEFSIDFPAENSRHLQKVELYLNLREERQEIFQSDTHILYDKFKPLMVQDPHGYFSSVDVVTTELDGLVTYRFNVTFNKTMEKSNLVVQYVDEVRNFRQIEFPEAIQVVKEAPIQTSNITSGLVEQLTTNRYEDVIKKNLEQGIDTADLLADQVDAIASDIKWNELLNLPLIEELEQPNLLEDLTQLEFGIGHKTALDRLKLKQAADWSSWKKEGKQIDPKLLHLFYSDDPESEAKRQGLLYKDGKTKVILESSITNPQLLESLQRLGSVDFVFGNSFQLTLDLRDLATLYSIVEGVVRTPQMPAQSGMTGVEFVKADLAHSAGVSGDGVRVAVIDLGFDTNNAKVSSRIVKEQSLRYGIDSSTLPASESERKHGNAVAELIIDTAPGADLFLYSIGNDLEFRAALRHAIEDNVDILVLPVGWSNLPTDGTSPITRSVSAAAAAGVVVVPAGNFAQRHWEGNYTDTNSNDWHEFADVDEGLSFKITQDRIKQGIPISINLLWNNQDEIVKDFDVLLVGPTKEIVAFSINSQVEKTDASFEQIQYLPDKEGTYVMGITYDGPYENLRTPLEVFSTNDDLEYYVPEGSVVVPTDAKGILVVGAADMSYDMAPFSSLGPTNDGNMAPHVFGPNSAGTVVYGDKPFTGTSAAAPHIAGIAALLLEVEPNTSIQEVLDYFLENSLQTIDSAMCTNYVGCGVASAEFIVP